MLCEERRKTGSATSKNVFGTPSSLTVLGELRQFGCAYTSRCLNGNPQEQRGQGRWKKGRSLAESHLDSFPSSELFFSASSPRGLSWQVNRQQLCCRQSNKAGVWGRGGNPCNFLSRVTRRAGFIKKRKAQSFGPARAC